MAKKNYTMQNKTKAKLGQLISILRQEKKISLRNFADAIGLSPSNLSYIENGANIPTPEVYQRIITELKPEAKNHQKMDKLYTDLRNLPPPDVCEIILRNPALCEKLRLLGDTELTVSHINAVEGLFSSFKGN